MAIGLRCEEHGEGALRVAEVGREAARRPDHDASAM